MHPISFLLPFSIFASFFQGVNLTAFLEGTIIAKGIQGHEKMAVQPGATGESIGLFYDRTNLIVIYTRHRPEEVGNELRTIGN
jgi:hypothetical protein